MVDHTRNENTTVECLDVESGSRTDGTSSINRTRLYREENKYEWDNKEQGLMLGGYFYGYTFMMPFAGLISAKFGVRRTITGFTDSLLQLV